MSSYLTDISYPVETYKFIFHLLFPYSIMMKNIQCYPISRGAIPWPRLKPLDLPSVE